MIERVSKSVTMLFVEQPQLYSPTYTRSTEHKVDRQTFYCLLLTPALEYDSALEGPTLYSTPTNDT